MSTKLQSHIAQAIEQAATRLEWSIYKDYSGRGMMGRKCFGITHSVFNDANMMLMLLQEIRHEDNNDLMVEVMEALSAPEGHIHSDSLGQDKITYWRYLEWPDEEPVVLPTEIKSVTDLLAFRYDASNMVHPDHNVYYNYKGRAIAIEAINSQGHFRLEGNISFWADSENGMVIDWNAFTVE